MDDEVIDLVARRPKLPKAKFATGRVLQIVEATARTERLRREYVADPTNEDKLRAVLRAVVPDATEEDWESCTNDDVMLIYDIALKTTLTAIAQIEARRKNDGGEKGGSPTKPRKARPSSPRSSPTTTSRSSARASGASLVAGGPTS